MSFDVMEDCVHLKACRRVQAIGKKHRLLVPRYCTEECSVYVSGKEIKDEVETACCRAFDYAADGNDWYHVDATKLINWITDGNKS